MDDYSDMDYSSESEEECGLEEAYDAAKELSADGKIDEAIDALQILIESDVERSKWSFKAGKRLVKIMMSQNHPELHDCYRRLFSYADSKAVTTKDMDKALDSLWARYCLAGNGVSEKRQYCLQTWELLRTFGSRISRLKWLGRWTSLYSTVDDWAEASSYLEELQEFLEHTGNLEDGEDFKRIIFDARLFLAELCSKQQRLEAVDYHLSRANQLADTEELKRAVLDARLTVVQFYLNQQWLSAVDEQLSRLNDLCVCEEHKRRLFDMSLSFLQMCIRQGHLARVDDQLSRLSDLSVCEEHTRILFDVRLSFLQKCIRQRHLASVDDQLCLLSMMSTETDLPAVSRAAFRELRASVHFAKGQYKKACSVVDNNSSVPFPPGRTGPHSERVNGQLRLIALFSPSTWFPPCDSELVQPIVDSYAARDLNGLRSAATSASEQIGDFAAIDICGALARNLVFRLVPSEAWVDVFACISRYEIDTLFVVSRRLTALVEANVQSLPLHSITWVRLISWPIVEVWTSPENGAIGKHRIFGRWDSFDDKDRGLWSQHVQLLLRHSVIGRVDLLGAIPTVTADDVVMTSVHIKTLSYAFCSKRKLPLASAIHSLRLIGVTRIDDLSVELGAQYLCKQVDISGFLQLLRGLCVSSLECTKHNSQSSTATPLLGVSLLEFCFVARSGPSLRVVIRGMGIGPDFVEQLIDVSEL
ncbi:Protein CSN-2 [Aphelenchoides avenae]|nr:Protein CSN-2 [Aphelenchus avenae]